MSAIKITLQNIYKELSTNPVDWLLANVGDKIRIETTFSVNAYCISSTTNPFILNATDGYVGTGWVVGFDDCFKDFKIGDTIEYYNQDDSSTGTFTIIDKLSDTEIRFNTPFTSTPDNCQKTDAIFSLKTAITSIKYYYNFIENGAANTFISPIDGSEQLLVNENKLASDTSASAMEFIGDKTWQTGSATVQGVSVGLVDGVWTSIYKIIHYTTVTPFILYNQIDNQQSGIYPSDFLTTKCWKLITKIVAAEAYLNPNFSVESTFSSVLGNSGWYNENYNTGKTNYSISNLKYNKGGTIVDSIVLSTDETIITFDINNTVDTPFSNNNTKFVLGLFKVPADPSEYTGNGVVLNQNFLYDRALQTVGSAAVNGDNYGGNYQLLKGISSKFVSTSKITITAKVSMASDVLASFSASSTPQYFLSCSIQNHTKQTADADNDLVSLQVEMNTFTVISSDPKMIVPTNVFIRHPESDPATEGVVRSFDSNSLIGTINISVQSQWMCFNPLMNRIYTGGAGHNITVINSNTNAIVTTIALGGTNNPDDICFDPVNNRIYVTTNLGNVVVIDCETNTVLTSIAGFNLPLLSAYCDVNKTIYVANKGTDEVKVIDTVTNTVVKTIIGFNDPIGVAYNSLNNTIYVTNQLTDNISIIDCTSDTITGTISLGASYDPYAICYSTASNKMYVRGNSSGKMKVIDCETNTVIATLTGFLSYNGYSITYNKLDDIIIFTNTQSAVSFIDCKTDTVTNSISLGAYTLDVAFDYFNYKIFVANNAGNSIWVISSPFDVYPQDEIVCCSNFYIESAGRETDEIILTSVKAEIMATDGTNEFTLDDFILQTSSYPLVGYTQQFDAQVARIFHIPVGTIRKYIEVKRRNDLDTGTRKYFSSNYPILFRWEKWIAALGINSHFFDSTQPNNGLNEWWYQYFQASGGWIINYRLTINATKNGVAQQYQLSQQITPHDYASNIAFTVKDVLPFEATDLALLLSGTGGAKQLVSGNTTYVTINGQKYYTDGTDMVYTYQKSLIAAIFTKSSTPSNVTVEIDVEVFEQGGVAGKRRYSSRWAADSDTWFSSIDGSDKVVFYAYGNSIVALCYFDPTSANFPANAKSWSFSGRIYEVPLSLATDDGVTITTDSGIQIQID